MTPLLLHFGGYILSRHDNVITPLFFITLVREPCYTTWIGIDCSLVLIIVILQYLRVIFIDNLKIDKTLTRKEPHKKGKTHYN